MTPDQARRLVRCYPRAWQERYGDELAVLLEQQLWSRSMVGDVLRSAFRQHGQHIYRVTAHILLRETGIWVWWLLASMVGWMSAIGLIFWSSLRYDVSAPTTPTGVLILRLVAGGLVGGAVLGTLQWLVLPWRVARAWVWIPATALGWLTGTILAAMTLVVSGPLHAWPWLGGHIVQGLFFGCTVGVVVGALQRRAIRPWVDVGNWWVPATSLSWGFGWVVGTFWSSVMLGGSGSSQGVDMSEVIIGPTAGGAVSGLISGLFLAARLRTHEPRAVTAHPPHVGRFVAGGMLALIGLMLVPTMIRRHGPAFTIQEMTSWPQQSPCALAPPQPVPSTTDTKTPAGTPRPGVGDVTDRIWEVTTVAEAQAHLPFHVLVPRVLPPGFVLAQVLVPRQVVTTAGYHDRSAFVHLIYADLARQQPMQDWRTEPGALPADALVIVERPVSRQPRVVAAYPGTARRSILGGHPAVLLNAVAVGHPGSCAVTPDASQIALVTVRDDTWIDVYGWRVAGVDQTTLQQMALSLR